MNFVQQLEECLRDLAAEARKKHPGVKEASERATLKLRSLQNAYISAVRASNHGDSEPPTTALFQSSELLHPFLLAANYPNASSRLLEISFRAMKLLMEGNAILPSDGIHLIRVWLIQAQVSVNYYQKLYSAKEVKPQPEPSSSGSWFWGSSSDTVSSSSGQTGSTTVSHKQIETLAKEILSCLLQLLELLGDQATSEVWTNAVALSSMWLSTLPAKHTVHEAARSTIRQVLLGVFRSSTLAVATWEDLLHLAPSTPETKRGGQLAGGFALCRKPQSSSSITVPPSAESALEWMAFVWSETPELSDKLMSRTMGVTMSLLQDISKSKTSVERTLRTLQWTLLFLGTQADDYPNECTELFLEMIKPIAVATEHCRSHHDFEDGYVYTHTQDLQTHTLEVGRRVMTVSVGSIISTTVLWKAGLCLEATNNVLERDTTALLMRLNGEYRGKSTSLVVALAEALSDFATIGASCRDHMLQIVDFADAQQQSTEVFEKSKALARVKLTLFRRAEQAVLSDNTSIFVEESGSTSSSKNAERHTSSILGESLWIAMQGMLRMADCLPKFENPLPILEETFAPTLSVLQHYLKRFTGSKELVQLALLGYSSLADVSIPMENASLQRKALLTSLCKLSLPSWGKHDTSCQLQDHHVRAVLFLCRIMHTHHDSISNEWEIILWTFEELSDLAVASPYVSDESYHAALAVSAVFGRFAPFSTSFSTKSLLHFVEALTEISKTAMQSRDVVGGTETVIPSRAIVTDATADKSAADQGTIGEKIMNIGVRAIYGTGSEMEKPAEYCTTERTKNTYYEEYRQDFVKRISAAKSTVRVGSLGKVPFSLALLTDVMMANTFRMEDCGDEFSELLSVLAASSPAVRPFAMDVLSMLTMSQVSVDKALPAPFLGPGRIVFPDPMQSQLWAVESLGGDKVDTAHKSQSQLLSPVCHTLLTAKKADVAESALGALGSILEGVGHNLTGDVWCTVVEAVGSLSGDPKYELDRSTSEWSSSCLMAFKCLKFIVDDFLEQLSSSQESSNSTKNALLDCCCAFGRSMHDVNTSLTAIGLLWTIADQDARPDTVDQALSRLMALASDPRPEVRNAAVNTLFSCIVGSGGTFSSARWEACFSESIFGVYVVVSTQDAAAVDNSVGRVQRSRYKVSLHHSRDSTSKQWVTTQVLVLRGLTRVLRNHFSQLLDTTASDQLSDVPWFEETWGRILDCAFEAASYRCDRDTFDICAVGVELLVLCCQMASTAGIQAAAAPARINTNMEVVNGALRSVRESQATKAGYERTQSAFTEACRKQLFCEAFDVLDSYREYIDKASRDVDRSDESFVQLLHKLGVGLTHLFECCRNNELAPREPENLSDALAASGDAGIVGLGDGHEPRFVLIVGTVLSASSLDKKSRFLNQSERCAISLLRALGLANSMAACRKLVVLAGSCFFLRGERANDESESSHTEEPESHDLVGKEAAKIVSEDVTKGLRDVCKTVLLYDVLELFLAGYEEPDFAQTHPSARRKRCYKRAVPVITNGLEAVVRLSEADGSERSVSLVWEKHIRVLSAMLAPIPIGKDIMKISRITEVMEIASSSVKCVPVKFRGELSTVLAFGAAKSLETARQHDELARVREGTEIGKKSKVQRDDLLKLFQVCFASSSALQPDDTLLRAIAKQVLMSEIEGSDSDQERAGGLRFWDEVTIIICRVICTTPGMEAIVLSVFSLLCKLVTSNKSSIREAAVEIFSTVDVGSALQQAQEKRDSAERRAEEAENRVGDLTRIVENLQRQNQQLRKEVAVLEASAVI